MNLSAGQGIALCEVPLTGGRCDYLFFVDRIPVGVVEAKKQGTTLSSVADQSGFYAENLPDFLAKLTSGSLRFLCESTCIETLFRDERDPHPRFAPRLRIPLARDEFHVLVLAADTFTSP